MSSGFSSKPAIGWIHSDQLISKQGASYDVRYIGCLEVTISVKILSFATRSHVAKECINKVCEVAGLKTVDKRRKVDKKILKAIADVPNMVDAGSNVTLTISSSNLSLISAEDNHVIASHEMPHIAFVSGGDSDTLDFVGYIAKDSDDFRACYVLECGGGLAKDVIATIGQAFDLRYKQYTNTISRSPNACVGLISASCSSGGDAEKDYYNDLPGKVPPDVGPPPVPPLPTVVAPLNKLPSVLQSPNLIDFNTEFNGFHMDNSNEIGAIAIAPSYTALTKNAEHDYVNDNLPVPSPRDIFDMQPFTERQFQRSTDLSELQNEVWFHGAISRADAERLLQNDGDFLVRESPNSEGQFVLSGIQDDTKKHLLLIDPEGVIRTKDRIFNSVSHLIKFHFFNVFPIISAESILVLRNPIPRPS